MALEKTRQEAVEQNLIYKQMYASQYNARHNVKDPSLSVGDLILVLAPPNQKFKNAKLQPLSDGPFPIVRLAIPNVYYQKGKKILVTHISRIKLVQSNITFDTGDAEVQSVPLGESTGARPKTRST